MVDDAPRPLAGRRILLVEDNAFNQMLARRMLEQLGVEVVVAEHGAAALEQLRQAEARFDLILMDVMMPVMDGCEATRQIREKLRLRIPIVAMTAGAFDSDRQRCLTAGMDDFLAKPIEIAQLLALVQRYSGGGGELPSDMPGRRMQANAADCFDPIMVASRLGCTQQQLIEFAREFVKNCRALMDSHALATRHGENTAAARDLSTLKGMVGTFGFDGLMRLAKDAELVTLAGAHDGDQATGQLFDALAGMLTEIDNWLRQLSQS
jgi:CheY-like chemotaxis protein